MLTKDVGNSVIAQPISFQFNIDNASFYAFTSSELHSTCKIDNQVNGPAFAVNYSDLKQAFSTETSYVESINRLCEIDGHESSYFCGHIIITQTPSLSTRDSQILLSLQSSKFNSSHIAECDLSGPVYIRDGRIYEVLELHADIQEAFSLATVFGKDGFYPLSASDGKRPMIGVPLRSKHECGKSTKPLCKLRVSIKDNIDLKGVKTSLSSRAWEELYPSKNTTGSSIQKLQDLGVSIVGKTKLSQFAEVETPTADWVDIHCPFNPRGDGYLIPALSTSGGAASVAAYDWLDVSIGTDTAGSLREPAAIQGLFGLKMTHGILPADGIVPLVSQLDSLGFLTRSIHIAKMMADAWLPETNVAVDWKPKKIVYIVDYLPKSSTAKELFETFMKSFEQYLNIERTVVDLNEQWLLDDPSDNNQSLSKYMGETATMDIMKHYELWHNTEAFRHEYRQVFKKEPYVDPPIKWKWQNGRNITKEQYEAAVERKNVFKSWFIDRILDPDTIIVTYLSSEEPLYRDVYTSGEMALDRDWMRNYIASMSGCPELMIPIGQIPYKSRNTGNSEWLPAVAAISGYPGYDKPMTNFVANLLSHTNQPQIVLTGSKAFDV